MQQQQRGFTLLEVLLVLTLSVWLLTEGLTSWQEWRDRQQAETYMQGLLNLVQAARVKAISQQQIVRVCPARDGQCVESWSQATPTAYIVDQVGSPPNLWFSYRQPWQGHGLSYNRSRLEFRADGGLNALQNGTFIYCARAYPWYFTMTVSQSGRSQYSEQQGSCPL